MHFKKTTLQNNMKLKPINLFDVAAKALAKSLHNESDWRVLFAICSKCEDGTEGLRCIRSVQNFMAEEIGYTKAAFARLCVSNGLRCLKPEVLKMVLINQQRMRPSAREWINSLV